MKTLDSLSKQIEKLQNTVDNLNVNIEILMSIYAPTNKSGNIDCLNCKYFDIDFLDYPCNKCLNKKEWCKN